MKRLVVTLLALALLIPVGTAAQGAPDFAMVYTVTPMQGQAADFENHTKMYIDWLGNQGGEFVWAAFEIMMGERSGQFVFGTFNHAMADFDTPDVDPAAQQEQMARHVTPYAAGYVGQLMRERRDLQTSPDDAPLSPYYQVIRFQIHPAEAETWTQALGMVKGAMESAGFEYSVFQTIVGGGASEWAISIPYASMAAMEPGDDDAMMQLIASQYGEFHAETLEEMFNKSVLSSSSELFALRADMSVNLPPM